VDKREDFAARISPRISLAWQPNAHWKITANAGGGFKAPDFRHLYLNFSNPQIGYSLLGAQAAPQELVRLQQQGLLQSGADITPFLTPRNLLPEYGNGIHLGAVYKAQRWNVSLGLFHNEVNNLIDVYSLSFTRSNGLPIYSYRNAGRIYTQGAEIEYQYRLNTHWKISAGYQYLIAKDRDVVEAIQQQKIYRRDPQTYETSLLTADQYIGLANRSKHIANGKLMYENQSQGWYAFLRVVYRGAYGWMDVNGNQVIDDTREMTSGFSLVNLSAAKNISPQFSIQAGIENLLNYTQAVQQPQLPGRQFFISLQFNLSKTLVKK
jgi:outer membrane receptor for ferrienterochelin and colicins